MGAILVDAVVTSLLCSARGRFPPLALVALLGACATPSAEEIPYTDNLSSVWGEMMAPYGLYPIFPVGSDSQPGDIVMLCDRAVLSGRELAERVDPEQALAKPRLEWVWVTTLDPAAVTDALNARAQTRMAYAAARTASSPTAASAPMGPQSVADPYRINQMATSVGFRSFPSVMSYTKSRSDVGVGGGAGIVAAGLGASKATNGYFILEVPGAEVVELNFEGLQAALAKTKADAAQKLRVESLLTSAISGNGKCREDTVMVVKAVYYTRRLTATMGSSAAAAFEARAAYQIPANSTRAEVNRAIGAWAYGASAPAGSASSSLPTDARMAQLVIEIDRIYNEADTNSKLGAPGVKVGLAKSAGKGIAMDYSFDLPMAFGMRLVPLPLSADRTLADNAGASGTLVRDPGDPTLMRHVMEGFQLGISPDLTPLWTPAPGPLSTSPKPQAAAPGTLSPPAGAASAVKPARAR